MVVLLEVTVEEGGSESTGEVTPNSCSAEPLSWFALSSDNGVGGGGNAGDSVVNGVGGGGKAASVGEVGAVSAKNLFDSALELGFMGFLPFNTANSGGGVGSGNSSSSSMMPSSSCSE